MRPFFRLCIRGDSYKLLIMSKISKIINYNHFQKIIIDHEKQSKSLPNNHIWEPWWRIIFPLCTCSESQGFFNTGIYFQNKYSCETHITIWDLKNTVFPIFVLVPTFVHLQASSSHSEVILARRFPPLPPPSRRHGATVTSTWAVPRFHFRHKK
jgi:hypothetical protein